MLIDFPLKNFSDILEYLSWWSKQNKTWQTIPLTVILEILRWRNMILFENFREHTIQVVDRIIEWYQLSMENRKNTTSTISKNPSPRDIYPATFFIGAAQRDVCGCGFWVRISKEQEFWVHWGFGRGTNMKDEIIAVWGLLFFTSYLDIPIIHIFGTQWLSLNTYWVKTRSDKSTCRDG